MKILIVDDEQLDLFISKKILSMEFEVEGFTSLPDAVNWAQNNSFDVLISDFYLATGVLAYNVLKEISAVKGGNTFQSFVLSNHIDEKQAEELRAAGFTGIIEKPLSIEKFKMVFKG